MNCWFPPWISHFYGQFPQLISHPGRCTRVVATPKMLQPTVNQSCVSAQKMKRLENQSHVLGGDTRGLVNIYSDEWWWNDELIWINGDLWWFMMIILVNVYSLRTWTWPFSSLIYPLKMIIYMLYFTRGYLEMVAKSCTNWLMWSTSNVVDRGW